MPTIAPWLQLPDFMGAARAGAQLGLSRAQLEQEGSLKAQELAQRAQEAAARLGLGGAELASNERLRTAQIASNKELAGSRLAQAARHYEDLNNLNQQKIGLSQDRISNLEQNRDLVNTLHQQQLDMAREKMTAAEKAAADRLAQQQALSAATTQRQQTQLAAREAGKIPTTDITIPTGPTVKGGWFSSNKTPSQTLKGVPINNPLVNQDPNIAGAPGFGTNYQSAASALLNPAVFRGPSTAGFSGPAHDEEADLANNTTIRVKHPNGQTGIIPQSQLEAALKEGYEPIQ